MSVYAQQGCTEGGGVHDSAWLNEQKCTLYLLNSTEVFMKESALLSTNLVIPLITWTH